MMKTPKTADESQKKKKKRKHETFVILNKAKSFGCMYDKSLIDQTCSVNMAGY